MEAAIYLLYLFCIGAIASREKHDSGTLSDIDTNRERRSVDDGKGADQLTPQQQEQKIPRDPFLMTPNMQASYFLGQCVMCPPGHPGPRGAPGPQGMPGRDGRDQILIGPVGENTLQSSGRSPDATPPPQRAGVSYVHWGQTDCSNTSKLIYQGVMGSSNNFNQKGSGVNYLCLPLEPTFAGTPNSGGGGAYVYGAEFENNLLTSPGIANNEASCAVCLAPSKGTVLVVPGTNSCPENQDWTLEYVGYIMSSIHNKNKSEFVCIDENALGIPRTGHNNNENLLYLAEAKCSASGGGLPCPPYIDGHDLLCAVCTL